MSSTGPSSGRSRLSRACCMERRWCTGRRLRPSRRSSSRKPGAAHLPICMAKTPLSLSAVPKLMGQPEGFSVEVRELRLFAEAVYPVVLLGDIQTMSGLGRYPLDHQIDIDEQGAILGLRWCSGSCAAATALWADGSARQLTFTPVQSPGKTPTLDEMPEGTTRDRRRAAGRPLRCDVCSAAGMLPAACHLLTVAAGGLGIGHRPYRHPHLRLHVPLHRRLPRPLFGSPHTTRSRVPPPHTPPAPSPATASALSGAEVGPHGEADHLTGAVEEGVMHPGDTLHLGEVLVPLPLGRGEQASPPATPPPQDDRPASSFLPCGSSLYRSSTARRTKPWSNVTIASVVGYGDDTGHIHLSGVTNRHHGRSLPDAIGDAPSPDRQPRPTDAYTQKVVEEEKRGRDYQRRRWAGFLG